MKNRKTFYKVLAVLLGITIFGTFVMGCNGSNGGNVAQGGNTEVSTPGSQGSLDGTETNTQNATESVDGTEGIESTEETETEDTEKKDLPDEAESALKEEEEILKITPTDDDVNNGSGSSEKETYTAPAAASAKNPIVKVATGTVPVSISSGKVPAGGTLYYKITTIKGKCLCIEDKDAYIVCDGKQYNANADGKVLVDIKTEVMEIAIGNKSTSAKNFVVTVDEPPLGSYGNPYVVDSLPDDGVVVSNEIAAGSAVYYKVSGVSGMTLTIEDSTAYVVYKDVKYTADSNGIVTVDLGSVDGAALFQIGNSSKTEAKIYNMSFAYVAGSEQNPIPLEYVEVAGGIECEVEIPAGKTLYYNSNAIGGTTLTVNDATANVIYKGQTYAAEANVVTVPIAANTGNNREPISFAIKNTGTSLAKYKLVFKYPEGSSGNPVVLNATGDYSHDFLAGAESYYYQWTAAEDGKLTFAISNTTTVGWQYSIVNDAKGIADTFDSTMQDASTKEYDVNVGDIIIIKIATYEEEAEAPAGTVHFALDFVETLSVANVSNVEAIVPEKITEVTDEEDTVEETETVEDTEGHEDTESIENVDSIENTEVIQNTENVE